MTLEERVEIGRSALRHPRPIVDYWMAFSVAWVLIHLYLICRHPIWVVGLVGIHLACTWMATFNGAGKTLEDIVMSPLAVLDDLNDLLKKRVAWIRDMQSLVSVPPVDRQTALPSCRVMAPCRVLDLSTGRVLGSLHEQMEDMAERTPERAAEIDALAAKAPEGLLVSNARRHVLVSEYGRILGIQKIRGG